MHMSDALLSPAVGLAFDAVALGTLALAAKRFAAEADFQKKVPLAGVLGAFVFGAQMLNFSIPVTGSSGHIGGGILLALMLGPWAGFLTLAAVLVIQCMFFADGGLLALGCNVFNLGFWPCFLGLPLYRRLAGAAPSPRRRMAATLAAVAVSLEAGAFGVVVQTLLSGRTELPFAAFAPIMLGIHLPIGLVEGAMTAALLQFVFRVRPDLSTLSPGTTPAAAGAWKPVLAVFAAGALLCAGVMSWFASTHPDGLEWSVGRIHGAPGLDRKPAGVGTMLAKLQEKTAFFPDYGFRKAETGSAETGAAPEQPGATTQAWPAVDAGTSVAGLVGAGLTALLVGGLAGGLWLARGGKRGRPHASRRPA